MTEPHHHPSRQGRKPAEEDVYALSTPATPPAPPRLESVLLPQRQRVDTTEELPPPPETFLAGVLRFPWYLQSLTPWVFCSVGLSLSFLGVVLCVWLVDNGLTMAAYAMRLSVCWVVTFAVCYLSGCFLAIVEGTANGWDEITEWPGGDWRDYLMSLRYPVGMLILAALVGTVAHWITFRVSWAVPLAAGFLVYPFFLLSAMESGSVAGFFSRPILQSYADCWRDWAVVYGISGAMLAGWLGWAFWFFPYETFFVAALSGPIVAAILFIYARLLGRLAWQAQEAAAKREAD